MSKFLYLECLDHKETSRPVGPVDHPYVVEDIRNQWVSGFIAPHVIAKLGLQFGPSDIYTRDTLFRNDQNRFQSQHQQCGRHVLIRNPAGIDVLVRTPDWACHQEGCDEPVTHGYFSKRFPGLGDILACRDHGLVSLFIRLMGWSILQLENIRSLARTLRNAELIKGSRVPFRRSVRQSESL